MLELGGSLVTPRRKDVERVLRAAFFDNVGLKLFSIAAAVALFTLVRGAEDAQRSIFIDLVAILPPTESGKILVSEVPDRVRLTVQGSRSLLKSIRAEDLGPVQADLRDITRRYYYFEPESLGLPVGVKTVQVAPASIPLTWADRIERRLPVVAELEGELEPGLAVAAAVPTTPERIVLRGPRSEVDPLDQIAAEPISVVGLGIGTHRRRTRLPRPPPHATYVGEVPIEVTIEIVPEREEATFSGLDVTVIGGAVRTLVRPATVDVTLRGPPLAIGGTDRDRVIPYVEVDGSTPLVGAIPAQVQVRGIGAEIEVVRIEPAEVLISPAGRRQAP